MKCLSRLFGFLLIYSGLTTCSQPGTQDLATIKLSNTSPVSYINYTFDISIDTSVIKLTDTSFYVLAGDEIVASELLQETPELPYHRLFVQTNLPANSTSNLDIRKHSNDSVKIFPKKTLAELWYKTGGYFEDQKYIGGEFHPFVSLRVPDECTDHSYYIKYEGPGWESDKVGYRLYLDWRNAIDIYGKKVNDIVLPHVGMDGYESYHEIADWGMDILKVGASLGIGTIGYWNGEKAERVAETDSIYCKIAANGKLYSEVIIDYYGWKIAGTSVDLKSSLSITAGSRATHHIATLSSNIDNLCTGIVKTEDVSMFSGDSTLQWNYIATWGMQSLAGDQLGMAVLFRQNLLQEITEDEYSHVVVLTPDNKQVDYYFLAAWEQEPQGLKNKTEFKAYLNDFIIRLSHPVDIEIMD